VAGALVAAALSLVAGSLLVLLGHAPDPVPAGLHEISQPNAGATVAFAAAVVLLARVGFVFDLGGRTLKLGLEETALFVGVLLLPAPHVVLGVAAAAVVDRIALRGPSAGNVADAASMVLASTLAILVVGALRVAGLDAPWAGLAAPPVYFVAASMLASAHVGASAGASALDVFRERFAGWTFLGAALATSLGLLVYALFRLSPLAAVAVVPTLLYLMRFGRLSQRKNEEIRTHERLAKATAEVAGESDVDGVAQRVMEASLELLSCGEVRLSLETERGRRLWSRRFAEASTEGITETLVTADARRVGEITIFARAGRESFGPRERHLLRTVAAGATSAVLNAQAIEAARRASRDLAESERRYRDLFDTTNVLILVLDERAVIVDANPAAAEVLGSSPEALVGLDAATLVLDEDRESFAAVLARLDAHDVARDVEVRFLREDGGVLTLLVDGRTSEGQRGARQRVLVARDITYLKDLEAERREAMARQAESIRRLENANRELEEFTLWTTHDMREPLRSVGTIARFLHEDIDHLEKDEARDMARRIHEGAERLKERVKALHAFSRIVQQDDAFEDVDLNGVVDGVLAAFEVKIREKSAEIDWPEGGFPTVRAQPHRIDQVFANLVENALKYGLAERPVVELAVEDEGERWRFSVTDNGPGIPEEYRERIFGLFQRGPRTDEAGSGAGLAIVKRIVEQHGGRVWLASEAGDGATFVFTLPKTRPRPGDREAPGVTASV